MPETTAADTADGYATRYFDGPTFGAFDPSDAAQRAAAVALRERFVEIGFGPERAAAAFGIDELSHLRIDRSAYYDTFALPHDAAGLAARFFVLHRVAAEGELRALLGTPLLRFLIEMAAVVRVAPGWRSVVGASWFGGRLIFSDARASDAVWGMDPLPDYVMPPFGDSLGLLRVAPREPRRLTLDVCCGAGAQALAATDYSAAVVGVDVNPRALRFARFNAAANGVDTATFVRSDCYDELGSARFDAILSNPPFVPWPEQDATLLYRNGGPLGDAVVAKILAGAIERLEPDGSLAVVADFANAALLPMRIRDWQSEPRETLILLQHSYEPLAYAESHSRHLRGPERDGLLVRLLRHFAEARIASLDFGYVVQSGRPGSVHVVRTAAARSGPIAADVSAWFAHQRRLARADTTEMTLELAPGLDLKRIFTRTADGGTIGSNYAVPGLASVLAPKELSDAALAVLDRVAAGNLRTRDVTDEQEGCELSQLLREGYVRLRGGA